MVVPLDDLLAYRGGLSDALTSEPVTSHTQLVALHQPDLHSIDGFTLQNLTGVARPAEPVSIVTSQGQTFPPGEMMDKGWLWPRYFLFVTFNRLVSVTSCAHKHLTNSSQMTAPVLRVECVWEDIRSVAPDAPETLRVAVDFHFNAMDDGTPGISDLEFYKSLVRDRLRDEIRFTTHGATSEGLPNALKHQAVLREHGLQVCKLLQGFVQTQTEQRLRLAFPRPLNPDDSAFASILPYTHGSAKLTSLSVPEWSALLPLRVQRDPTELLYAPAPYPMVSFECGDQYATVTDAAVELYESSRIAAVEQEVQLREWASVSHQGILYEVSFNT